MSLPSALSFGGYFYLHALPSSGTRAPILTVYGNFQGFSVHVDSAGKLKVWDYNAGAIDSATGTTTLAINTFYYLWVRAPSGFGQVLLYLDGSTTADFTTSGNIALPSGGTMRIEWSTNQAGIDDTVRYADSSLDAWKSWNADLAASNANTEKTSHTLTTSTNALGAWWMDGTDVTDHHSTNNHLTAVGTLSAGVDSPIDVVVVPPPVFRRQMAMQQRAA